MKGTSLHKHTREEKPETDDHLFQRVYMAGDGLGLISHVAALHVAALSGGPGCSRAPRGRTGEAAPIKRDRCQRAPAGG